MGGEHFLFWEASGPLHFDRSGTLNEPAQLSQCPRCFRFSTPLVHSLTKVSRLCFALSVFVFCFCALAGSAVPALVSLPSSLGTLLCAVWFCALTGSAVPALVSLPSSALYMGRTSIPLSSLATRSFPCLHYPALTIFTHRPRVVLVAGAVTCEGEPFLPALP